MSQNYQYNTIEEALRDLKEGKIILVTDDPDRENEGDLICAAKSKLNPLSISALRNSWRLSAFTSQYPLQIIHW